MSRWSVTGRPSWTTSRGRSRARERWVLLGPNGSGKTTLLRVVGSSLWPTGGKVELLGERLGHVDMRELRRRIAVVSASLARALRPGLPALDVVLTGRHAALETWWNEYSDQDRARAGALLSDAGFGAAEFAGPTLRPAVRRRAPASAVGPGPDGKPGSPVDGRAGGRTRPRGPGAPARPPGLTGRRSGRAAADLRHASPGGDPSRCHPRRALRRARLLAAGPVDEVLTSDAVSCAFDVDVVVERRHGRFLARSS